MPKKVKEKEKNLDISEEAHKAIYYLEKYEGLRYIQHINTGKYSMVAKMFHDEIEQPIAVKCTTDPGRMEMEFWKTFDNKNVARLLDFYIFERCVVFIMPLYRKDLWSISKRSKFYEDQFSYNFCRVWFRDILFGLAYLHSRRASHLSLKMDNIFLMDDGHVCIGDFSHMILKNKANEWNYFLEYFQPPEFTPYFTEVSGVPCSPRRNLLGDAADVWEFGILAIDLLTGRKVATEKNSSYEVWKFDVFPFIQKIIGDDKYLKHLLERKFKSQTFLDKDVVVCHDFIRKLLNFNPTKRILAQDASLDSYLDVDWPAAERPKSGSPDMESLMPQISGTSNLTPDIKRQVPSLIYMPSSSKSLPPVSRFGTSSAAEGDSSPESVLNLPISRIKRRPFVIPEIIITESSPQRRLSPVNKGNKNLLQVPVRQRRKKRRNRPLSDSHTS